MVGSQNIMDEGLTKIQVPGLIIRSSSICYLSKIENGSVTSSGELPRHRLDRQIKPALAAMRTRLRGRLEEGTNKPIWQ